MKTLLPQGFSRSLISFTTCGYLPCSRQNSLNLATQNPQGCPGNLRGSLRQEDAGKSRSANCRERSPRRERARGGSVPLPWSCEDSSALVRASETFDPDRIGIIPVSARRMTSDRRRSDHRHFLARRMAIQCDGRAIAPIIKTSRGPTTPVSSPDKDDASHRVPHLPPALPARHTLAGATIRQQFAARNPFKLPHSCDSSKAAPPLLPNPKAKRSYSSPLQLRLWIAQMGRYQRGGRGRASRNIERHVLRTAVAHVAATAFPIQCVSKCKT
jgi:hypothetical protein